MIKKNNTLFKCSCIICACEKICIIFYKHYILFSYCLPYQTMNFKEMFSDSGIQYKVGARSTNDAMGRNCYWDFLYR
jgi:hypothetical protein